MNIISPKSQQVKYGTPGGKKPRPQTGDNTFLGRDKSLLSGMSTNRRGTTFNLLHQESLRLKSNNSRNEKINIMSGPISEDHSFVSLKSVENMRLSPQITSIDSLQKPLKPKIKNNFLDFDRK